MTMHRGRRALVTLATAATLILGGCGSGSKDNAEAGADQTLVLVQASAPASMNPNIDKLRANVRVQNQILEAAIQYKWRDGKYVLDPTLVTKWEHTADHIWTFTVRPDVEFSNGEKLTADAFAYTLKEILDFKGGKLSFFFKNWKINVVDEMTFTVESQAANDTTVPGLMTQFFVVAPKYFAEVGAVKFGEKPIGTGPYVLTSFQPGTEVKLDANPTYWGKKASIAHVVVRAVPDDATRASQLLAGQATISDGIPVQLIERVNTSNNAEIRSVPTASTYFLMFNMNLKPFDDVRVRQALNYALDRDALVDDLLKETAQPSFQWYVPVYPGFDPNYKPFTHNPAKAKELLAAAGHPNGVEIDFYFPIGSIPMGQQAAEVVQSQLQKSGFKVNMKGGDPTSVRNNFLAGEATGVLLNNYAPPSLDVATLFAYYLTEGSAYSKTAVSPRAVELVGKAAAEPDEATRNNLYADAQKIFLGEESLFAPLWTSVDTWGVDKNLTFVPEPFQAYYMNEMAFNK